MQGQPMRCRIWIPGHTNGQRIFTRLVTWRPPISTGRYPAGEGWV